MSKNDRRTVLLVGLGNIGLRHLQGLAPLARRLDLWGVDLDEAGVARARAEWEAIPGAEGQFATSIPAASPAPDLVILATSAGGREGLTMTVLDRGARSLVLEKVVFDNRAAFDRVGEALRSRGAAARVNCARRMWPVYQALAGICAAAGSPVRLRARGRALGLACNGVHFIDLLQMLSGGQDVRCLESELSAPWPSKRPGFYEAWGRAAFATPAGGRLELVVEAHGPEAVEVELEIGDRVLRIEEAAGLVHEAGRPTAIFGRAPYQSELTAAMAAGLLDTGDSLLPDLRTSQQAHAALFDALTASFEAAGLARDGRIPIT